MQSIYLLGADYGFGPTVVENYRSVLEDERVEIIGEEFVPRQYESWETLHDVVRAEGPDAIVAGLSAFQLSRLLSTYLRGSYDFRVFGGFGNQRWCKTIGEVLREELGQLIEENLNEANLGPFTSRYHFNQYDNDVNETSTLLYTRAYGTPPLPDIPTSGGFAAASALDQAVRASGSTDGLEIIGMFPGMTATDTLRGKNRYTCHMDSTQAISPITVAKLTPAGQWKATWGPHSYQGSPSL